LSCAHLSAERKGFNIYAFRGFFNASRPSVLLGSVKGAYGAKNIFRSLPDHRWIGEPFPSVNTLLNIGAIVEVNSL
jgi:hypothetical protein